MHFRNILIQKNCSRSAHRKSDPKLFNEWLVALRPIVYRRDQGQKGKCLSWGYFLRQASHQDDKQQRQTLHVSSTAKHLQVRQKKLVFPTLFSRTLKRQSQRVKQRQFLRVCCLFTIFLLIWHAPLTFMTVL